MGETRGRLLLIGMVVLGLTSVATPSWGACVRITSVPVVITTSGVYCLNRNLTYPGLSGSAIEIVVDHVVIDLQGRRLAGAAHPGTLAFGVLARDRSHITIRNGTVTGFLQGLLLEDLAPAPTSGGHVIEQIRAIDNLFKGIVVYGRGNIVRDNLVVNTGGSTIFGANASAFGIDLFGPGARALNNDVVQTVKQGTGISVGIQFGATDTIAVNNRITDSIYGIAGFGKCRDNVTTNVGTPYVNCTLIGFN